jgi:hypothetical protein
MAKNTPLLSRKNCPRHWFSRKAPFFSPKLAKITENGDHNIEPSFY